MVHSGICPHCCAVSDSHIHYIVNVTKTAKSEHKGRNRVKTSKNINQLCITEPDLATYRFIKLSDKFNANVDASSNLFWVLDIMGVDAYSEFWMSNRAHLSVPLPRQDIWTHHILAPENYCAHKVAVMWPENLGMVIHNAIIIWSSHSKKIMRYCLISCNCCDLTKHQPELWSFGYRFLSPGPKLNVSTCSTFVGDKYTKEV